MQMCRQRPAKVFQTMCDSSPLLCSGVDIIFGKESDHKSPKAKIGAGIFPPLGTVCWMGVVRGFIYPAAFGGGHS